MAEPKKERKEKEERVCAKCQGSWSNDIFPSGDILSWASFDEPKIFSYGLSGQFELLSDDTFSEGDRVCNKCLSALKYQEHLGTVCDHCQKAYLSLGQGLGGWGCNADITDDEVLAGYGSQFDDHIFEYGENGRPSYLKEDMVICDECLSNFQRDGILKPFKSSYDHFEPSAGVIAINIPCPPTSKI